MDADSIVISGISGRFPGCDNTDELLKGLLDGKDLVSENHGRWANDFYGMSNRGGIMKDIEGFDNEFFMASPRQADGMDPRTRILLENTFEALIDAGIHPMDIRGSNTGVFIGMTTSRGTDSVFENRINFARIGRSMAMTSGMLSFFYDFKGPSYALDTACSSSLYAFCQAFRAIKGGECDSAIVCGASIVLDPYDSFEYKTMSILSPTGKCKFLDEERDGFIRSESTAVTYLQKSKDAKRIYATIKGCGTNTDGFKIEGVTKPSAEVQAALMKSIYKEFDINPLDITYMEAHGTGTQAGDLKETMSIAEALCKNRKEPLLVGSVKTNIGHTEMSSGLTSIIKVILTMESGLIPPILHLNKIGEDLVAVQEGKIKPVTELTPWKRGLIGVNSFGVGGTNAHVVLEPNLKLNNTSPSETSIRLVQVAGRNEKGLENFLQLVKNNANNRDLFALLNAIFKRQSRLYHHRGFILFDGEDIVLEKKSLGVEGRPVWFIYSGIGSQWPHMGRHLLKLDRFKQSLEECAIALAPYNIDLIDVICNGEAEVFKNVTNCFISIVAMSICLTDFLRFLDIEPDGMIGHSVGEICCAYADGLITKTEAMLIANARGVALQREPSIDGTLASVGLTVEEAYVSLPEDISIACYNCIDNITISGPIESVKKYVRKLKSEGKFAEVIQGANIAYHSKYIKKAGDVLLELLKGIIHERKICSKKWVSSSVKSEIESDEEVFHCPEYHRNNLVNSVHFQAAMKRVPKNAVVIELSPKGLLQTIIRRNLGSEGKVLALSSETAQSNYRYLFSAVGELYLAGLHPNLMKLYNSNAFLPVSRGTPSLAPLLEWERSMKCKVSYYSPEKSFGECIAVDPTDPAMKYLEGHKVEGKPIFPVMGYACLAWEIFARLQKKPMSEVPVVMENIKFRRMTLLPKDNSVIFNVNILNSNGDFEVSEGGAVVCFGNIKLIPDIKKAFSSSPEYDNSCHKTYSLNQKDVYHKLRLLGLQYEDFFQGILESRGSNGKLRWRDQWVSFLDAMIHYLAVIMPDKKLYLPESIGKLIIDPEGHLELASTLNNEIPIKCNVETNNFQCGKIEIRDLQVVEIFSSKSQVKPKLEKYQFVSYEIPEIITLYDCIHLILQIVIENLKEFSQLKILEQEGVFYDENKENNFSQTLIEVLKEEMVIKVVHNKDEFIKESTKLGKYDLVIMDRVPGYMAENDWQRTFFLVKENDICTKDILESLNFARVSKFFTNDGSFLLIKQKKPLSKEIKVINISTESLEWVNELKNTMKSLKENPQRIYLLSENEDTSGIVGLFNCLRFEEGGTLARIFFLPKKGSGKFPRDRFYKEQIEKDLSVNIFKNSLWGSYRFLPFKKKALKDCKEAHAKVIVPGDVSTIKMVENFSYSSSRFPKVYVYYAGMNFKDVLIGNNILRLPGKDQNNFEIGYEFAGRTLDGQRVFGIRKYHTFATVIEPENPLWSVPDDWSLEEAASVPLIYLTLYFAFDYKTKLEPNQSILIHSASGGVGMAAIQMALNRRCTVYATVGSEEKKQALLSVFPQLDVRNIFSSRDDSFEALVRTATKGKGVDVVLNSLIGDLFNASLRCVATNGKFVEIGKTEFIINTKIQSGLFMKSASLHSIFIEDILSKEQESVMKRIVQRFTEDLTKGYVKPIPQRKIFDIEDITNAFKEFQSKDHTGKVIIKIRDEEESLIVPPSTKVMQAIPQLFFSPKKSYIIIGGLGGLGLELAKSFSLKGATHIILNSRSPPKDGYQFEVMNILETWNTVVYLNHDDTSMFGNAEKLLKKANEIAPVGGIFNLAMVNRDAVLENQTVEYFEEVFKPKGLVTKNLDILSRSLCPELDHFVAFSSITCGKGNLGQTNYGFANSTMERIIEKRNEDGLPGLVIQWGPIADVGYFAKTSKKEGVGHFVAQSVNSYLDVIDEFLISRCGVLASSLFRKNIQSFQVGDSLLESVLKLFGITNLAKVGDNDTLLDLGMDSLMGFEIKQYLYREHEFDMSLEKLRSLTISEIKEIDRKQKK